MRKFNCKHEHELGNQLLLQAVVKVYKISVHNVAEQNIEEAFPSWNMYIQASGHISFVLGE